MRPVKPSMNDMGTGYNTRAQKAIGNNVLYWFIQLRGIQVLRMSRFAIVSIPFLLLLAACDLLGAGTTADATPTPQATIAATAAVPQATAEVPDSPPQPSAVTSLRLWLPPEIGARTQEGADELLSQVRAYESSHSNLNVTIEQKPVDGPGGIINYLQTGSEVAPSIIPDVVAVPAALLADSRYRDLFIPLNPYFAAPILDDVYTSPAGQVVHDSQVMGFPFASIGLTHLIFDPEVITTTVPITWTQLISNTNQTLALPADSREGAMLGLQFYLAEGGTLADGTGRAILEPEPLARALANIGVRKENLLQSHQLKTLDEAWQYHQLGLSDFMWTRAEFLLARQALDPTLIDSLDYSAVPGTVGPLTPLTTNWAWAITTDDLARQALAADLIAYLVAPENSAGWSSRSFALPAGRTALAMLAEDNPYLAFAGQELERARPLPVSETSRLMDVLGDAVYQVLTTELTPEQIAEQAAAALRQ